MMPKQSWTTIGSVAREGRASPGVPDESEVLAKDLSRGTQGSRMVQPFCVVGGLAGVPVVPWPAPAAVSFFFSSCPLPPPLVITRLPKKSGRSSAEETGTTAWCVQNLPDRLFSFASPNRKSPRQRRERSCIMIQGRPRLSSDRSAPPRNDPRVRRAYGRKADVRPTR